MAPDLGSRARLQGAHELHWYPAVADVPLRQGWFWRPAGQTPKTAPELLRIYEQSVGRNAVLQLNLSPDTSGRIPEADLACLREFGARLRDLFATNPLARSDAHVQPMAPQPDGA